MLYGWDRSERMLDSGGFESRQRVLIPDAVVEGSESSARWLGTAYWLTVGRVSRGSVRTAAVARPLIEGLKNPTICPRGAT